MTQSDKSANDYRSEFRNVLKESSPGKGVKTQPNSKLTRPLNFTENTRNITAEREKKNPNDRSES